MTEATIVSQWRDDVLERLEVVYVLTFASEDDHLARLLERYEAMRCSVDCAAEWIASDYAAYED